MGSGEDGNVNPVTLDGCCEHIVVQLPALCAPARTVHPAGWRPGAQTLLPFASETDAARQSMPSFLSL